MKQGVGDEGVGAYDRGRSRGIGMHRFGVLLRIKLLFAFNRLAQFFVGFRERNSSNPGHIRLVPSFSTICEKIHVHAAAPNNLFILDYVASASSIPRSSPVYHEEM